VTLQQPPAGMRILQCFVGLEAVHVQLQQLSTKKPSNTFARPQLMGDQKESRPLQNSGSFDQR
jgi:hypothetical protein